MVTLQIDGGKKQKLRPGDVVGCLTGDQTLSSEDLGKITVFDRCVYVAVKRSVAKKALERIQTGQLKGRSFRVRRIG